MRVPTAPTCAGVSVLEFDILEGVLGHVSVFICSSLITLYGASLIKVLFHYALVQDIEYSSLCNRVGPYYLSILYIMVCICSSQTPNLTVPQPPPLLLGNPKAVLYVPESVSVLWIGSFVSYFRSHM